MVSQDFSLSMQNAPRTSGDTSPTFDWQNAPTNKDPSFFLTLEAWLACLLQSFPPMALIDCAFFTSCPISASSIIIHNIEFNVKLFIKLTKASIKGNFS